MPTTKQVATQQALDRNAIEALAIIGGQRTKDEDITFEGTKFVFPEQFRGDLNGLQDFIDRYINAQSETIVVAKTFDYRPMDGAHATYIKLKEYFGYAQSTAKQGRFGPEPPSEITIAIGYVDGVLQHTTVPWGDMVLPLVGATLKMRTEHSPRPGELFVLAHRVSQGAQGDRRRAVQGDRALPPREFDLPRACRQRWDGVLRHRASRSQPVRLQRTGLGRCGDTHPVSDARCQGARLARA